MKEIKDTIQSQYANSKKMITLIEGLNNIIDPLSDIDLLYKNYFLVENAQGVLLDIWGRIVVIDRNIKIKELTHFSFNGQNAENFDNSNFIATGVSNVYRLSDDAYKTLILLKIASNISGSNAENINKVLQGIFPNKKVYVLERSNMRIRYVFEFVLEDFEKAIIEEIDILPNGAGVGVEYLEIEPQETFGFYESEMHGFNEATFAEFGLISI